ncbi:MAG: PmoA family protein [Pirellulales bacterium]|nr:PmoA family protein [Pirellulales bacterium]
MKRFIFTFCVSAAAITMSMFKPLPAQTSDAKLTVALKNDKSVIVKAGERDVLEYRCQPTPNKPYVRQLLTPGGVQILRDSPGDHKHHHALMFALEAEKIDFWGEQSGAGIQKPRSIETHLDAGNAILTTKLDWIDPQADKRLVEEWRRIVLFAAPELHATLLSWRCTLEPAKGKESVALGGHHYYGLGMRFVTSMDEEGEFLYSDKKESESVRGSEKLTPARWCAYRSAAEGKPVTVAMFDAPANPRHPNKFFTMRPFAYLSATLNLWKEPMTLKAGKPLELTYGVAAWDGHVEATEIEKTYRQWVMLEKENNR